MIVHTVRRGQFLRTLRPPGDSCVPAQISQLQVGMEGHIVVQTSLEECSNRKVHRTYGTVFKHRQKDTFKQVSQPAYVCEVSIIQVIALFNTPWMPIPKICLFLQGKFSIHVYSVNGCLLSSFTMEEQVTAVHLVSEYVILGTAQGSLHIRDLCR